MKTQIPDQLKADLPQTKWGKILSATPVVMTVIATMLAGLSSSEMTRAQYDRSLAAQQQSKAGDQWSYFQAKKLRGAMQKNSFELLTATEDILPMPNPVLENLPVPPTVEAGPDLQLAIQAIEKQAPETEITALLLKVDDLTLAKALQAARDNALAFDTLLAPANQALAGMEKSLPPGNKPAARNLTAAKMKFSASRYDIEAKLNQAIANLLELQVRKNNISAEHHHRRSQKFFYGMLAAQLAVIMSTFAMAARAKNFLWSIAAAAGLVAIVFAIYVYLRV